MDADWSVELGKGDPFLEFPWASDDGVLAYVDVKGHPEKVDEIEEVRGRPELADFVRVVNEPASCLITAKCDVWIEDELGESEEIYDAKLKFCSYVDLLFAEDRIRSSFLRNEGLAKSLATALSNFDGEPGSDDLPAAAEFIVRRCCYRSDVTAADPTELREGFYITFYLFGYGGDETEACSRWCEGLKRVTPVLVRFAA
jgi:hypothetical protein